jgi:hypothetical protein
MSCKNRNQLEIEFENNLPPTDQVLLENIVTSYDNFINTTYSNNENEFFSHIASNQSTLKEFNMQEYCQLVKLFEKSTLEYKSKNVKYDSVYLSDQGTIISVMQEEDIIEDGLQFDEEIEFFSQQKTIEEQIEEVKVRGYWRFISDSSFKLALSKIAKDKPDIQAYIDRKDVAVYINPKKMAKSMLDNDINENDYFVKRIIAIELFIQQIKIEYGC